MIANDTLDDLFANAKAQSPLRAVMEAMLPPHPTPHVWHDDALRPLLAHAHRHVAFALRFIVEGDGAFTAVGGEQAAPAAPAALGAYRAEH